VVVEEPGMTAAVLVLAAAVLVLACAVLVLAAVVAVALAPNSARAGGVYPPVDRHGRAERSNGVRKFSHGLSQRDAADILGVSQKTIDRDLSESFDSSRETPEQSERPFAQPRESNDSPLKPPAGIPERDEPSVPVPDEAVTDFIESSPDVQRARRFDWAGVDELLGRGLLARCLPVRWRARAPPRAAARSVSPGARPARQINQVLVDFETTVA
jgi:hypothetical protein